MTDVRAFSPTPMDMALVGRLARSQFLTDTVTALTRGVNPLESALLSTVPLADLGLPTLILREGDHGYLGQIRHRSGDRHAQLVCLAPEPDVVGEETQWLHLLDGLVQAAAKRGAHSLRVEISERDFEIIQLLRQAGFWIYARQSIYRADPGSIYMVSDQERLKVRLATDRDMNRILALQGNLVPSLVQQLLPLPDEEDLHGFVVETISDGRLVGFVEVVDGKSGLLMKPLLHPDIYEDEATRVFAEVLRSLPKAERVPVYICVLGFQESLRLPLLSLGLIEISRQAVLVKHMTVKKRQTDEVVQAAREIIFGSSLVTAIEIDRDITP